MGFHVKGKRKIRKVWYYVLAVLVAGAALMFGCLNKSEYTVGKDLKENQIEEFWYTEASSTNPPSFQRYRLYLQGSEYCFYHETREGDHWPLNESDITESGTIIMNQEEWSGFYETLKDGIVRKREESAESGGTDVSTFLYWTKDRDTIQQFSFASRQKQSEFEDLCMKFRDMERNN